MTRAADPMTVAIREGVGARLLDLGFERKSSRAYVYDTARRMDLSGKSANSRIDSDGVKLVATTMGKEVADAAIQVLGGYGYVGEYTVERLWRDAKLLEIGGGTLEAHEKNITKDLSRSFEQVLA